MAEDKHHCLTKRKKRAACGRLGPDRGANTTDLPLDSGGDMRIAADPKSANVTEKSAVLVWLLLLYILLQVLFGGVSLASTPIRTYSTAADIEREKWRRDFENATLLGGSRLLQLIVLSAPPDRRASDELRKSTLIDLLLSNDLNRKERFMLAGVCVNGTLRTICRDHRYLQKALRLDPGNLALRFLLLKDILATGNDLQRAIDGSELRKSTALEIYYGHGIKEVKAALIAFHNSNPLPIARTVGKDVLTDVIAKYTGLTVQQVVSIHIENALAHRINNLTTNYQMWSGQIVGLPYSVCEALINEGLCQYVSDIMTSSSELFYQRNASSILKQIAKARGDYLAYQNAVIQVCRLSGCRMPGNQLRKFAILFPTFDDLFIDNLESLGRANSKRFATEKFRTYVSDQGFVLSDVPEECINDPSISDEDYLRLHGEDNFFRESLSAFYR